MSAEATPILVIGAGGHAKVLIDALMARDEIIEGLLDADPTRRGSDVLGYPVLGSDDILAHRLPDSMRLVNGIGSNRNTDTKRVVYERLAAHGHRFAPVVHPSAVIGREATLGDGVQLLARSVVESGVALGVNVTVNTGAIVNHDSRIGNHVHIAPAAVVLGSVTIGPSTLIGAGAVILPGRHIGRDCIIGAGAVVTIDIDDGTTAYGVPAHNR